MSGSLSHARHHLRALPAMVRIGVASALAYRAEMIVWLFAYTIPLIMLALWTAVAREAPVGRFGEREFQAYFLAMLVVRFSTGVWVVWEMNWEIRQGTLSQRLLKPLHPLLGYACENLGAVPLRLVLMLPVIAGSLLWVGPGVLSRDPVQLMLFPLTLVGAWIMLFCAMAMLGTLGLYTESSLSFAELWLGAYMALSGYVVPVELFPGWLRGILDWLPFRWMLGFPVETLLGLRDRASTLHGLGVQAAWCALLLAGMLLLWRAGVKRFAAYGG